MAVLVSDEEPDNEHRRPPEPNCTGDEHYDAWASGPYGYSAETEGGRHRHGDPERKCD
jgi:hypothetical protein